MDLITLQLAKKNTNKEITSQKGVANGIATLDTNTKIPISQIPDSLVGAVTYKGAWDANSNTPVLASGVGNKGYYYVVSVEGITNINGITDWKVGDWIIFNGSVWEKIDNTDVGEINTASNVGTGEGQVFKQKSGVNLQLKTIKAGTNVNIVNNNDDITINVSGGSEGEVTFITGENITAGRLVDLKSGKLYNSEIKLNRLKSGKTWWYKFNASHATGCIAYQSLYINNQVVVFYFNSSYRLCVARVGFNQVKKSIITTGYVQNITTADAGAESHIRVFKKNDNYAYVVYGVGSDIKACLINLTNFTQSSAPQVVAAGTYSVYWHSAVLMADGRVLIVYPKTSSSTGSVILSESGGSMTVSAESVLSATWAPSQDTPQLVSLKTGAVGFFARRSDATSVLKCMALMIQGDVVTISPDGQNHTITPSGGIQGFNTFLARAASNGVEWFVYAGARSNTGVLTEQILDIMENTPTDYAVTYIDIGAASTEMMGVVRGYNLDIKAGLQLYLSYLSTNETLAAVAKEVTYDGTVGTYDYDVKPFTNGLAPASGVLNSNASIIKIDDNIAAVYMDDSQTGNYYNNGAFEILYNDISPYFIGIATETKLAGQSCKVITSGKVTGLSGLVAGTVYYANKDGTLSSTDNGNAQIGYALSSTELMLDIKER